MRDVAILVVTNVPDRSVAEAMARALLEQRLAACVNIGGGVDSLYHWQGRIETGEELPVLVKTRTALYPYVEDAIRKIHPYDTPEVIAIPVVAIDARYLAWLEAETRRPPDGRVASTDGAPR
ncbi:MAG TPA: divalent-cation tolerance protein CutA [Casimicrobiaceae bacterium]|nr:divalent-cation tolerance protein CutA [Casimicrobiaceae bacterium]